MAFSDAFGPYDASPTRPLGPLDPSMDQPTGDLEYGTTGDRVRADLIRQILLEAGLDLYAYDERMVRWMARQDTPTIRTILGWVVRAHLAGLDTAALDASTLAGALNAQAGGLLTSLLKTALGNQATGATSAADKITTRVVNLENTWGTR